MCRRPVGERPLRLLRRIERRVLVCRVRDLVEHARDVAAQELKVVLAARFRVALIARRRRIVLGPRPIDFGCRQCHDMQTRLVGRSANGHREHHLLIETRELAVTDDARAVVQEEAQQRGIGRVCGRRGCKAHECDEDGDPQRHEGELVLYGIVVEIL